MSRPTIHRHQINDFQSHMGTDDREGDTDMKPTPEQRDEFIKAYIVAALWYAPQMEDGIESPLDEYDFSDLSVEATAQCEKDCDDFLAKMDSMPEYHSDENSDADMAGNDFFLTRNGHGAGFWDRDLGKVGDDLTELSETFDNFDLYDAGGTVEALQ